MFKKIIFIVIIALFTISSLFSEEEKYIIKAGDQLQITVIGTIENLNTTATVDARGKIYVNWAGEVSVAGLGFEEAAEKIKEKLSKYFKNFQVAVTFIPQKPKFSIVGEIQKPGIYEISPNLTLLDAILLSGGTTEKASNEIKITRGREVLIIDLKKIIEEGDISNNIFILPGDIIYLPISTANKVTLLGQVLKPGEYEIPLTKNIIDLIISAGGLLSSRVITAPTTGIFLYQRPSIFQVILRRKDNSSISIFIDSATLSVLDKEKENIKLESGDVIYIKEIKYTVVVLGEVNSPNVYEFKMGDRITDAIAAAGGFTRTAHLKEIGLIRKHGFVKINMNKILKGGDIKENLELQDQDVIYIPKRTRRVDWDKIVSRISSADTIRDILKKWGVIR